MHTSLTRSAAALLLLAALGTAVAEERATLRGHTNIVWTVVFAPDGKTLASAGNDNTVRLWDVASGKEVRVLKGHNEGIRALAYTRDGKRLASAAHDGQVRLWDPATGQALASLDGHAKGALGVAFSPDGKQLAVASGDSAVKIWDPATSKLVRTLTGHEGQVFAVAFSPDGKTLASASQDRTIKMWNVATGRERFHIKVKWYAVLSIAFAPNGRKLASAGAADEGKMSLWDPESGEEIGTKKAHDKIVTAIVFSPDGRWLATAGHAEMCAKLWDVNRGGQVAEYKAHKLAVLGVAISPDSKLLATASADQTVKLWDLSTAGEASSAVPPKVSETPRTPPKPEPPPRVTTGPITTPPSSGTGPQTGASGDRVALAQPSNLVKDSARNEIIKWIKANNRFGPDHRIVTDMTQTIDAEIKKGTLYYGLAFGGGLLKSGRPHWLHSWGDRFFVFELTEDQAKRMDLSRTGVSVSTSGIKQNERRGAQLVRLDSPAFAGGRAIAGNQALTGKVNAQVLQPPTGKYALRLGYHAGRNTVQLFHHLDAPLPKEKGAIPFSYRALHDGNDEKHTGPVVCFMDLVIVAEKDGKIDVTVHSNPVAVLVDVR